MPQLHVHSVSKRQPHVTNLGMKPATRRQNILLSRGQQDNDVCNLVMCDFRHACLRIWRRLLYVCEVDKVPILNLFALC